jgi:hypothetical protein
MPTARRPRTQRKRGAVLAQGHHGSRGSRDGVMEALDNNPLSEAEARYRDSNSTLAKVHTSIIRAKEKKEKDRMKLERFEKEGPPTELVEFIRHLHE